MVVLAAVAGVAAVGAMVAGAVRSRDSARRRVEWREHAHDVRERNQRREHERLHRFDPPGPSAGAPDVTEPADVEVHIPQPRSEIVIPRPRSGNTGPIPAQR